MTHPSFLGVPGEFPTAGAPVQPPFSLLIGPFRLAVRFTSRREMETRARLAELDVNQGVLRLHNSLEGKKLAYHFFKALVKAFHYANGCRQGSDEESFTVSFTNGLVAFAQNNPHAWVWFNRLLSESISKRARFEDTARRFPPKKHRLPKLLSLPGHPIQVRLFGDRLHNRTRSYGFYDYGTKELTLYDKLQDANLVVVFVHELTHAVHHWGRMKNRDTLARFVNCEVDGWLSLIADNPSTWRWILAHCVAIREGHRVTLDTKAA